jgi:hypothetical protein
MKIGNEISSLNTSAKRYTKYSNIPLKMSLSEPVYLKVFLNRLYFKLLYCSVFSNYPYTFMRMQKKSTTSGSFLACYGHFLSDINSLNILWSNELYFFKKEGNNYKINTEGTIYKKY